MGQAQGWVNRGLLPLQHRLSGTLCLKAGQNVCSDICASTGALLVLLSCHTEIKYFNSLVVESLGVQEAWPTLQEHLVQRKDFPSWSAGCKDEQNILAHGHDVSALDNLTLRTSQMAQEFWTSGFLYLSAGSKGSYNTKQFSLRRVA